MPKIVKRPKTRYEIQQASDARKGIKTKTFKLPLAEIEFIIQAGKDLQMSQSDLITKAVRAYVESQTTHQSTDQTANNQKG